MRHNRGLRGGMAVLLFVILSLVLAAALLRGWFGLPNPVYQLHFDLAGVVFRLSVLLALLLLVGMLFWHWSQRQAAQARWQERQDQEAARRDFLKRLDHELKNPLTIMHLAVTNLQQNATSDLTAGESLARISQQTQRLQKLVRDLRWLAELEEGQIEQTSVDLGDVLQEAVALAEEAVSESPRPVNLQVQETPWPLAPVAGDRELLVLAFRNLVENALKFTAVSDRVEVRASENGQTAVIEVADNGPGIAPEEQRLIFENLYRSPNARAVPGSGLGLSLVEQIARLHGGSVEVRSRAGAGTVFTVHLPLHD